MMRNLSLLASAAALSAACAHAAPADSVPSLAATIAAMPKNVTRAPAPPLDAAIGAAHAALDACAARGVKVSVIVADTEGHPVVVLSGDGVGYRSQLIAQSKVNVVARFHVASSEVERRAKSDPALLAQAEADPGIGQLRAGGLPVYRGGTWSGIVAVGGASLAGGDLTLDETCARAAKAHLEGT